MSFGPVKADRDDPPGPACTLCGSTDTRFRFAKGGYDHFHCRSCTALFLHPIPSREELAAFYRKTEGEQKSNLCWTSSRRHVWHTWRWALKRIERLGGRGPLLDVGCGTGQFLDFAGRRGWPERVGVELSPEASKIARKSTGATIHTVDLLDAGLPPGSFSGVTLWDVIEHLADPHAALREIRRLLRPGGALIITAPHRHGLTMRILKHRALIVIPPEHLTYYTRRSMRLLLHAERFSVESIRCLDVYIREWTRCFARARGREPQEGAIYRGFYDRLVQSNLFLFLMRIANGFLGLANLGDQMICVAQKQNREM